MATTEVLTEREQQALEHMRKAQELGVTLKEYAGSFGLDVKKLYQLRKPLVRKGALGPVRREAREARTADKASAFLPVRVVPATPTPGSPAVSCRLVHPSGWVLECDGLPPASWMAVVLAGGAHATA
jgi:hypothetical protein